VAAVSLSEPVGWDYAAGHALLRGAGGTLVNERGEEVRYSPDGNSSCSSCFGGAAAVIDKLWQRDWESVRATYLPPVAPFALVRPQRGRVCADPGRLSRAQGCLLGQLAGDALGGLVEFKDLQTIQTKYPR